jgi:glucose-6-phosphate isomerase
MRNLLINPLGLNNTALLYATVKNQLNKMRFRIELFSFFVPRLMRFAKWWMRLYGESEDKDGKGIFPTMRNFSEDLHSLGRFV